MARLVLFIVTSLLSLWATCATAGSLPEQAEAVLKTGKPWVRGSQSGDAAMILAAIEIDVPPRMVWAAMLDCARVRKMIANLTVCRVVDSGPGWDVREQVTAGTLFVPALRSLYRSDYMPFSRIVFRRTGGDLKVMQGEWRLEARNGGRSTRVIYENRRAANVLAPPSVVRAGLRADCGKVLINLKKIASSL
jgi:hypothetical protein